MAYIAKKNVLYYNIRGDFLLMTFLKGAGNAEEN